MVNTKQTQGHFRRFFVSSWMVRDFFYFILNLIVVAFVLFCFGVFILQLLHGYIMVSSSMMSCDPLHVSLHHVCFLCFSVVSFPFAYLFCPTIVYFYCRVYFLLFYFILLIFLDACLYSNEKKKERGLRWVENRGGYGKNWRQKV